MNVMKIVQENFFVWILTKNDFPLRKQFFGWTESFSIAETCKNLGKNEFPTLFKVMHPFKKSEKIYVTFQDMVPNIYFLCGRFFVGCYKNSVLNIS